MILRWLWRVQIYAAVTASQSCVWLRAACRSAIGSGEQICKG